MTTQDRKPSHPCLTSVEDIVTKYTSATGVEVAGLLHALGIYFVYNYPCPEAVAFLCKVGNNGDRNKAPWEEWSDARVDARKVIVRHVLKEINERPRPYTAKAAPIHQTLVPFFAKKSHCYLSNNTADQKILATFLKKCWDEWPERGLFLRELTHATIHAGCADLLPARMEVRIYLYQYLLEEVEVEEGSTFYAELETLATNDQVLRVCGKILSFNQGSHLDQEKLVATRLLQLQAMNASVMRP